MKTSKDLVQEGEGVLLDRTKFVVHRHQARSLHYDLRLEMEDVLKSWAIPKEPPLQPGVKRLAIEVEDHPLDYISFKGIISEGQYGAGNVEIWDSGEYIIIKKQHVLLAVDFKGRLLNGEYRLVRMKEKQWLFFKTGHRSLQ